MKWFKNIGRDGTKMAWIAIILIAIATVTGLFLFPIAVAKWDKLIQLKDNIYDLIGKVYTIVAVPVINELRKAWEGKNPKKEEVS